MTPRRPSTRTLLLPPRTADTPAHRWLYAALRDAILGGQLRAGTRLPGTRHLAAQAGLARGTVVRAFEQLTAEGYTTGAVGSGTIVNAKLPDELLTVARGRPTNAKRASSSPVAPVRRLSGFARRVQAFSGIALRPMRAFRANQPAAELFPASLWAQVSSRRARHATATQLLGCAPSGYRPLREAIADYLRTARGVRCQVAQVVVVTGVQEALDIVARLVLDPGERACMEDPGYRGARVTFEALGAVVDGVRVDHEGMVVPRGRAAHARLAYVTPAHQYPLGTSMSLGRRLALLDWAHSHGALIFEDDYDSEYRYAGQPLPALQGLDTHGSVLFAGSFSKVLFPSLRLGYLVVPEDLVDRVAAIKSVTHRHAPVLDQATLAEFMTEGHFGRHVRRMREVYAARLGVLLEQARTRLAGVLDVSGVEAGLQTVGYLAAGLNAESVAAAAGARDVEVVPLSRFSRRPLGREGLQLGFAAVDVPEIRRGIDVLADILASGARPQGGGMARSRSAHLRA